MDAPPPETAGQPIRLSPAGSKNSTVIFTLTASEAVPPIILSPSPTAAAPAVILPPVPPVPLPTVPAQPIVFSPTPPASGTPPALDGLKAADSPERPLATNATPSNKSNPLEPEVNK